MAIKLIKKSKQPLSGVIALALISAQSYIHNIYLGVPIILLGAFIGIYALGVFK